MRRRALALAAALGISATLGLAAALLPLPAAAADPDPELPATVSDKIVGDLANADLERFATDAARYMTPSATERLKNNFASIKDLGQSQYSEIVYTRDFGRTEKDIIYKINFDKAFTFVRFLWHVDGGKWHLVHVMFKTEDDLPLPKGWEHIYPK